MDARGSMLGVLMVAAVVSANPAAATEAAAAHWLRDRETGCYIYEADAQPADGASWFGRCVDRVASGNGTAVFTQGGRFVESVSGTFARGAAEGGVRVNRADGSHFEGSAVFGRFSEAVESMPHAPAPEAAVLAQAMGAPRSITNPAPPQDDMQAQKGVVLSPWLDELAGQKLVAADGSALRLSAGPRAVTVEIVSASGAVQNTEFKFLNGNQGTISASEQPQTVLGTFRVSDLGLTAEYADGRSDRLWRDPSGTFALRLALADGRSFCTRWYADGHTFTKSERETALNEYAKQLGLSPKTAESQDCLATAEEQPPAETPAKGNHRPPAAKAATAKTAALDSPGDNAPIEVRMATVHLIDADASAEGIPLVEPVAHPVGIALRADAAPQSCLSIEPENGSWGFRNACGYEVQFAYCVQGMASRACDAETHSGSAPANAFAGLFSEREAGTAPYGFRWIVCKGGSSDVEARLLRADPPVGECRKMRPGAVLLAAKTHAP